MEQLERLRFHLQLPARGPQQKAVISMGPWELGGRAQAREAGPVAFRASLLENVPGGLPQHRQCFAHTWAR